MGLSLSVKDKRFRWEHHSDRCPSQGYSAAVESTGVSSFAIELLACMVALFPKLQMASVEVEYGSAHT